VRRLPRSLLCLSLLSTAACSADAIAGPAPAASTAVLRTDVRSELQAVKAAAPQPKAAPSVSGFYCRRTLSSPSEPLYIIDGVVSTEGDALAQLDANAIDSIQVVKGPEAATIYGSRAAAGVVIVTTRNPRPARR
jgi:TonB-dependent SusC/RagA subfamily outer membrane receptor